MVRLPVSRFATLALAALLGGTTLHAGLLFNTGTSGVSPLSRDANTPGVAAPVTVSTATTLTNIAFDLYMSNGGTIKYMIFDSTGNTRLFTSAPQTVASSSTPSFVVSTDFSYVLPVGTYYIGVIGNLDASHPMVLESFSPGLAHTENNLSLLPASGYANYTNYFFPARASGGGGGGGGTGNFALELFGTQGGGGDDGGGDGGGTAPEPATFGLIGAALLAIGGRYHFKHRA
jgi:hypothetical protein